MSSVKHILIFYQNLIGSSAAFFSNGHNRGNLAGEGCVSNK